MRDELAADVAGHGDDDRLRELLKEVCRVTGMGFAAVAHVTRERWITSQVEDRIAFGIGPGDELKVQETICDEIRESGEAIFIDHVLADPRWRAHPVPAQYGFQSYVSIPVRLDDGTFYGTLCAIDPRPRSVSDESMVALLASYAREVAAILSRTVACSPAQPLPGA